MTETNGQVKSPRVAALEEFIRVWQTSRTLAEVCEMLGLQRSAASRKAFDLRQRSVPLKKMPTGPKKGKPHYDVAALADLARSLSSEEGLG